uniref:Uncharacterized protein n=1 Tax=Avena sativa TaxID=4498 RepID=A0ACD6A3I4_AVESA
MGPVTQLLPRSLLSLALRPAAPTGSGARASRLAPPRRWLHQRAGLSSPVSAVSPSVGEQVELDWLDTWCPLAPVCDLDPGAPHGKTVLGLHVVAWYDRAASEWRVFEDECPHRRAPLSEGRIDGKGRLQCVYHGWCFDGRGSCEFIPQAPALGPPVHKKSKACVAAYPTVVQNNVLWFYPRAGAEHRDVLQRKRPPLIPEIDDPSFTTAYGLRDLPLGFDMLMENLMDPAHLPYAHKGLWERLRYKEDPGRAEFDLEGGRPLKMKVEEANVDGFLSRQDNGGYIRYAAPFTVYYGSPLPGDQEPPEAHKNTKKPRFLLAFMCVPVAPGRSRMIWAFPRNYGLWLNNIMPRWFFHIAQNALLDSDLYLLHVEERNYVRAGVENWHKVVYAPTSSDAVVLAFRNWFTKHCKSHIGWAAPVVDQLPTTPTKDRLMDRYWSHVAQCTSCSAALRAMKALEVALQVASVAVVGFLAASKGTLVMSVTQRAALVSLAVLCFATSRWLAGFVQKNFYFQDYVHADK